MSDELKIDDGAARDDVVTRPKGHQRLGLALVLISVAQLMVVLDATIANIALPFIGKDLDISGSDLTSIVTGYSLVFGGLLLLLGGRLADLYGRRRIFMTGLVVFAVASLLGGLAQDELLLLSARGLQGFGGALRGARRPGPDRHNLPGRARPQPGVRDLRRHVRRRWRRRPDPRWLADRHRFQPVRRRRPRLADDLPHQRADRHRHRHPRAALPTQV